MFFISFHIVDFYRARKGKFGAESQIWTDEGTNVDTFPLTCTKTSFSATPKMLRIFVRFFAPAKRVTHKVSQIRSLSIAQQETFNPKPCALDLAWLSPHKLFRCMHEKRSFSARQKSERFLFGFVTVYMIAASQINIAVVHRWKKFNQKPYI